MNKLFLLIFCLCLVVSYAFAQDEYQWDDVVFNGYSVATNGGTGAVNLPGLRNTYSVAVDPDGKVWTGSYYSRRLENTAGLPDLDRYPDLFYVITQHDTGTGVYLDTTEYWVKPIWIYDPSDGTIDTIKFVTNPDASIDTLQAGHRGMGTDHEGNIIVGFSNGNVYKFNYQTYDCMAKYTVVGGGGGRPGVDAEGFVFQMDGVFASTVDILDPDDWSAPYNQITGISAGVTRGMEVSPDGKHVYMASGNGGFHHYYSSDGVDGTYALEDTIMAQYGGALFNGQLAQWHPSGVLWLGSYDDVAPRAIVAVDPDQNYAIVDSLNEFEFWGNTNGSDTTNGGYCQPWYLRCSRDAAFAANGGEFYASDFYGYTVKKWLNPHLLGVKPGEDSKNVPGIFTMYVNYPNPFNPTTTLPFDLHKKAHVNLKIYDSLGRLINVAINKEMDIGNHKYVFNGSDLATGAYYYKITVDTKVVTGRLMLVK